MKKLEYMEFYSFRPSDGVKRLNELGLEGWELVTCNMHFSGGGPTLYYILKREINNTLLGE